MEKFGDSSAPLDLSAAPELTETAARG
jgi:hypothetical protein